MEPGWGREIFYVSPNYSLMAVSLKITGEKVEPSTPQELFHLPAMDLSRVDLTLRGRRCAEVPGPRHAAAIHQPHCRLARASE